MTMAVRSLLAVVFVFVALRAGAEESGKAPPIKALLITGGCCHDYDNQKYILPQGISARANVTWTVVHQGGDDRNVMIDIYKKPDWIKDFDVVVHNECFGGVTDDDFVNSIATAHRESGVPAVMIHCAAHSYRNAKTEQWRQLLGISTFSHESQRPLEVKNVNAEHPIMQGFPETWLTTKDELYKNTKVWPNVTPLGTSRGVDGKDHVLIWTNTDGPARVFATTLGHTNEVMLHENYLGLVSRGLLWATEKLDDQGRPLPGYEGHGKPIELPKKPASQGQPTPAK